MHNFDLHFQLYFVNDIFNRGVAQLLVFHTVTNSLCSLQRKPFVIQKNRKKKYNFLW